MLKIPYWIQLNEKVTNILFNIDRDFSRGYPLGFVSKNCILPERFVYMGELRLIKEIKSLPIEIKKPIILSIENRFIKGRVGSVISKEILDLIKSECEHHL